ncbi:MAG: PDZ domain-containing protein [Thermoanaerobaculia bacterium]|nr:PDZ domain-containing protein [Thermoanaerobaculia bacterium]
MNRIVFHPPSNSPINSGGAPRTVALDSTRWFVVGLATLVSLTLLALAPTPAEARRFQPSRTIDLPLTGGEVEVSIRPDHSRPLALRPDGPHRWTFDGSTADLIGESYSIVLRNRTSERIKVVVGVDGLNIYRKNPIVGNADGDIGSILGPWSTRELPGWQLDLDHAQRFVFSPPEWSEGQGIRDAKIGTINVEVYREWRQPIWEERDAASGNAEPQRKSRAEAPSSARTEQEQIGTTSGEDIGNSVRTVTFHAASRYPEARAVIDYGNAESAPTYPTFDRLGMDLESTYGGSRVVAIAPGSVADRAGLEASDVILRVDSRPNPSPEELRQVWRGKNRGDYIFLRVRRGGRDLALKVRA